MCTPQAAAIFQVIGTVAQFSARQQQAQMENARREQARLNAARARDIQANQLAIRVKQEQDVKAQEEFDNQIAVMEAKEASKLANIGSGLGGNILRNWGNYYERSKLTSATNFNTEIDNLATQYFADLQGLDAQAENRVNQNQPVAEPNPLMMFADIGMTMAEYAQATSEDRVLDGRNQKI